MVIYHSWNKGIWESTHNCIRARRILCQRRDEEKREARRPHLRDAQRELKLLVNPSIASHLYSSGVLYIFIFHNIEHFQNVIQNVDENSSLFSELNSPSSLHLLPTFPPSSLYLHIVCIFSFVYSCIPKFVTPSTFPVGANLRPVHSRLGSSWQPSGSLTYQKYEICFKRNARAIRLQKVFNYNIIKIDKLSAAIASRGYATQTETQTPIHTHVLYWECVPEIIIYMRCERNSCSTHVSED